MKPTNSMIFYRFILLTSTALNVFQLRQNIIEWFLGLDFVRQFLVKNVMYLLWDGIKYRIGW